ncbi:heavy-metal-associated domain-containing protein [Thiohalorhabdus sp.]|uniref:heavy-metal-associated domain-containing protein n=1 Tax=Thiohalorhabdus sp. TaxID=3094134 RepID=UPI002FC27CE6
METTFKVSVMHCGNCADRVTKALEALDGVSAEVSHEDGMAHIQHPEQVSVADLEAAVRTAGYTAEPT